MNDTTPEVMPTPVFMAAAAAEEAAEVALLPPLPTLPMADDVRRLGEVEDDDEEEPPSP